MAASTVFFLYKLSLSSVNSLNSLLCNYILPAFLSTVLCCLYSVSVSILKGRDGPGWRFGHLGQWMDVKGRRSLIESAMMMQQQRPCMRRLVPLMEDNKSPDLWEGESIDFVLSHVECALKASETLGQGMLYITSKRVIWIGDEGKSCDLDVPYIIMHAVSRDPETYPKPCIYCQLDCDEYAEEEDELNEFFLAPEEEIDLMKIFDALSHAALINPDPMEEGEQEGDDELIYNVDEVRLGAEQAKALDHLESVFQVPKEFQQMEEEDEQDQKKQKMGQDGH